MFTEIIERAATLKAARGSNTKHTKKKTVTKTVTSKKTTQSPRSPQRKK